MITLHFLQKLSDDGFGDISLGDDEGQLFWEKLPLDKNGVAIFSRGAAYNRRTRMVQSFDLYARGTSDLDSAQRLEAILDYMVDNYVICDLPEVPGYSEEQYVGAVIVPTTNIENFLTDEQDRVIFRLAGQIMYNKIRS